MDTELVCPLGAGCKHSVFNSKSVRSQRKFSWFYTLRVLK